MNAIDTDSRFSKGRAGTMPPTPARLAALLAAVVEASRHLLAGGELVPAMNRAVAALGEGIGLDRVYIFRHDPAEAQSVLLAAWQVPGVIDYAATLPPGTALADDDFPEVIGPLRAGRVYRSSAPERTGLNAEFNLANGVQSDLMAPVFASGNFWGCVGFDDCRAERDWSEPETDVLRGAAAAIGAAVERAELETRRQADEAVCSAERERTARERGAELARENSILRLCSESLANLEDLHGFLLRVVRSAMEWAGAACGGVGLLSADGGSLRIVAFADDSGPGGSPRDHPVELPLISLEGPARLAWEAIHTAPGYWWAGPEHPSFEPAIREYHRARGHRQIAHVPLRVGGEVAGFLALAFRGEVRPSEARLEMLGALAEQAALAVSLTRLTEADKRAAVAREQEKAARERAAELAKANSALRRAITGLAGIGSLDAFLAEMLAAALEVASARNGAVVLVRPGEGGGSDAAEHIVLMEEGRRVPRAEQERAGTWRVPINAALRAHMNATRDSSDVWSPPPDDLLHTPSFVAYHRARGNRAVRIVPMVVAGEVIGWLGFGFAQADPPGGTRLELLRTLAEQMTVAVELTRLADGARQAAVIREREAAARERAAELAKVNATLRRGLDRVADLGSFDAYVASLLAEGAEVFGADAAAVFLRDGEAGTRFRPLAVVDDGRLLPAAEIAGDPFLGAYARVSAEDRGGLFSAIVASGHGQTVLDERLAEIWPEAFGWHAARGHRVAWQFPLRVRGQMRGFLAFALRRSGPPTDTQVESVAALAQQFTLALELTRFAEAARREAGQTATLEERNRLSRDLHDTLSQGFAGIIAQLGGAEGALGAGQADTVRRCLDRAMAAARSSLMEARRAVHALRPGSLAEDASLERALREVLALIVADTPLRTSLRVTGAPRPLPAASAGALVRISQELLANTLRHAGADAREFSLELAWGEAELRLTARDDGGGFDPRQATDGFGLTGIRERVQAFGGHFDLRAAPGAGTVVSVRFSLPGENDPSLVNSPPTTNDPFA